MPRRTSRSSRGDNGTVEAGLSHDIDLDGGVATRVVDVAGVNLGDRHVGWNWEKVSLGRLEEVCLRGDRLVSGDGDEAERNRCGREDVSEKGLLVR